MQARRILPPRTSRGRMPQKFQQQNTKANFNQKQLTQKIVNIKSPKKKNQRHKVQQKIEISQIQLQYKNMSAYNKLVYPYARGYHYFFDLNTFPRLQNSVTYSIDQNNVFNHTYSQDNKQIKQGLLIGDLLNRSLFGLPYVTSPLAPPKTRTKNPCHHYLFQNQDRKYCADKNIYQLQQIIRNFQKLEANGSLHTFSCLKKDIDLMEIFEDGISTQQKKNILRQKLQIIKQRKQSTQHIFVQEDKKFYYHSLNQKLHNEIEIKTNEISFKQIMGQLEKTQNLKQNLTKNGVNNEKLTQIFVYKNTNKSCLSSSIKLKIQKVINNNKQKIQNMSAPFMFLSFANNMIMTVSQKLLALRLANLNEAAYFVCKDFWKKIFGRNLTINRQIKIFSRNQYQKSASNALTQLNKWKKQQDLKQKNNSIEKFLPKLDNFVNLQIVDEKSKNLDLFRMQNQVQINSRQYFVLILFYQLYQCLAQIHQFIMNYQNLYEIIASQHFNKAYHYFAQLLGSVKMGILEDLLRKLTQWIMRADIETDFRLYWVYKQDAGIAYIIKTKKQTNCQFEKQNKKQSKQQIFDIINLKRTK